MMKRNFIYVFSKSDADKLKSMGYEMLVEDGGANMYIFVDNDKINYDFNDIKIYRTNVLVFERWACEKK